MKVWMTLLTLLVSLVLGIACNDTKKSDADVAIDTDVATENDAITDEEILPDSDGILPDGEEKDDEDGVATESEAKPDDDTYVIGECIPVTITDVVLVSSRYEGGLTTAIGAEALQDFFSLQFYIDETTLQTELAVGSYDLGAGKNKNYATCTECALIFEDYDPDAGTIAKRYFQYDGSIEISEVKEGTLESKGTISARLVEVTIESGTYISTPVPGGTCYEVTGSWDTICVPNCEGKVCGSDGCGGICGDGCEPGTQCNAEQTGCVPCTVIHITDIASNTNYPNVYEGSLVENIGDEAFEDFFWIEFYGEQNVGSYDLTDTNYADCPWCVMVVQDASEDPNALPKYFFQETGTLVIEAINPMEDEMGAESKGHLEGVRLVEVTIDENYTSTPVPGGACLQIAHAAWDTMPDSEPVPDNDTETPDE